MKPRQPAPDSEAWLTRFTGGTPCGLWCLWLHWAWLNSWACRGSGSASCSCLPRWRCTAASASCVVPQTRPSTTWRVVVCPPSTTGWRPEPTGCRQLRFWAWRVRCISRVTTALPLFWGGAVASASWPCFSRRICASLANSPFLIFWVSVMGGTGPGCWVSAPPCCVRSPTWWRRFTG